MSINIAKEKNMKNGIWDNQEVKDLFLSIEKIKESGLPLRQAFIDHAKKYKRQPNSVRNYYYHEVDNLVKDEKRLKELNIDMTKHRKSEIQYFTEEEENSLLEKIDKLIKSGCSVRKACLSLSNGDVNQMLRFQNKYRNFKAKEKPLVKDNIIKFTKKKQSITDSELQALFMGLVRLVKRNAQEEVGEQMKDFVDKANYQLRQTIVALNNKEREYKELKEQFLKIKEENSKLVKDVFKLKCDKASKLKQKFESVAK